ncbi:unnamed protein product [Schistocephalus solidus]|uniref:Secreted protein n=1 Tax=Schistocephalus solidus TaxID=70667 RepID=A0A183SWS1_SCHSO|nr:unnamed protein product [Schistocephalus solidus]
MELVVVVHAIVTFMLMIVLEAEQLYALEDGDGWNCAAVTVADQDGENRRDDDVVDTAEEDDGGGGGC